MNVVVEVHIFLSYLYIGIERENCGGYENDIVCLLDEGKVFICFLLGLMWSNGFTTFQSAVRIVFVQYKTTNLANMRIVIVQLITARADY